MRMSEREKEKRRDARMYGKWTMANLRNVKMYTCLANDWNTFINNDRLDADVRKVAEERAVAQRAIAAQEAERAIVNARRAAHAALESMS